MIFAILLIFLTYRFWFFPGTFASGDWPYLFKETILNFSLTPDPKSLWLGPYYQWTSKLFVQYLNLPWEVAERFWWFWMFLVIAFCSSYYLAKVVFKEPNFRFITPVVFLTNTYILMVVGGGQMGVALSYAFAPAVLASFIKILHSSKKERFGTFLFGVLLGLHVMFDPRIAYITVLVMLLYLILMFLVEKKKKQIITTTINGIVVGGFITLLINLPWIITEFINKSSATIIPSFSDSGGALSFFSFGSFSQAFSLLHPNWPENIFGKTYFLRPEFLVLPLLAFSSLLFVNNVTKALKRDIIFFALIGLVGTFLSKGVQEPFGQIYTLLFYHLPGFFVFRDPTKFYLMIVLSYSILIPFHLKQLSEKVVSKKLKNGYLLFFVVFLVLWGILIREALLGKLSGTFRPHAVPNEYTQLKDYLQSDAQKGAILWLPTTSPFTFFSNNHPAIVASEVLGNKALSSISPLFLKKENIEYIVVPEDTEGKIFLKDRKYSEQEYEQTVGLLRKNPSLMQAEEFGKIVVFKALQ